MDPQLLQFSGLMFLLFAGVIVVAIGMKLAEVYRPRNWVLTTGTVTKSEVRSHRGEPKAEGEQLTSAPIVTYKYEAGGEPLRATRINFAEKIGRPQPAQRWIAGRKFVRALKPSHGIKRVFWYL